jgi:hypothetical protein
MLVRAVWAALKAEDQDKLPVERLSVMGDQDLLTWLADCRVPQAKQLGSMLEARRLYKRVDQVERGVVEADRTRNRLEEMATIFCKDPAARVRIENEVSDLCGLDPGDILIYCPDPNMNLKAAGMLVTWRDSVKPLSEVDDPVIRNRTQGILESHKNLWQCKVFIHPDKRNDEAVLRRVRDVVSCHLKGDGTYTRETIELVLHDLAEKEHIPLIASRAREISNAVLAPASKGEPLSRSLLLAELRKSV